MKKISVIILNWNGRKMLEQFLPSVVHNTSEVWAEIVVADNGSDDDSVDFLRQTYPNVKLIQLEKNYGFAEGYNKAIALCETEYVVLLNSDVETPEGWIEPLAEYMESHPEVVASQPKILSYNEKYKFEHAGAAGGFIDNYGFPYCRGRIFSDVEEDRGQYDTVTQVFWATGAALFIRRANYLAVGGLDASFFAHMEEIDLCWRLNSRGGKLVCIPQSKVYHLGGGTLSTSNPRKTYLNFRNNLLMIYKNETEGRVSRILLMRKFFDNLAALMFLMKGEKENFQAVRKARKEFKKIKKQYQDKRKENLKLQKVCEYNYNYKGSIVFAYYMRKKRSFEQLK